jgi:hypothetical protein
MTKTVFALVTAGILGTAMLSTGANAMVPDRSTNLRTGQTTLTQEQARLNKERQMLRRDVRLGRTVEAARLRRQINADERAMSQAKRGMQETRTPARPMQPDQAKIPQAPTTSQPDQTTK